MIRPEDMGDPNWCPDCGEPRGVCRCEEMLSDAWAPALDFDDDEYHGISCTCETCLQNHPERDVLYGTGEYFDWADD